MDHANIDLLYEISHNVSNNNVFITIIFKFPQHINDLIKRVRDFSVSYNKIVH